MRSVKEIPIIPGTPVLVRSPLNVPIAGGRVANDYRLRRALPTLTYLAERGARVVVVSHIGEQGTETLAPVAARLGELISHVSFSPLTVGEGARAAVRALAPGDILVLENLRRAGGEVKNDASFARELAALADFFVQDSFDTCHRPHASIIGVPKFLPAYAGLLLAEEVRELSQATTPTHPALAVIGGAKFVTKEAVLETLLHSYDRVFVGGALANDFIRAAGHGVGKSLTSPGDESALRALLKNPKLVLPLDALVVRENEAQAPDAHEHARVALIGDIRDDEVALDHGPGTSALLAHLAGQAKSFLWNGPLGRYENGFTDTTDALARAVAGSGAHSVVGGGDTVAAIEELGLLERFSFVSTGGGAMLDFLAKGTLPGIEALG